MNLCEDLLTSAKSRLRPQTKTVVTDKKLNQYEEVLQPDGTYLRKPLGNKKEQLSADEKAYFIDKQLASIWEDRLYLSNADVAKDREQLLKSGITHIVNLATGVGELFPNDFQYLSLQIADNPMEKLSTVVDKSVQFINAAHAHGSGTRVLVHCNQGVSRSSAVVIAYLMKCKRLRLMDAYNYVAAIRPSIQPNFGFMEQLNQLDVQLFLTSNANNTVDDT